MKTCTLGEAHTLYTRSQKESVPVSVHLIKRIRPLMSMHATIKIYKGLIEPHFDYCSVVWDGLSKQPSENYKNYKIALPE